MEEKKKEYLKKVKELMNLGNEMLEVYYDEENIDSFMEEVDIMTGHCDICYSLLLKYTK